jgi:hypothetical protein
LMGRPERWNTRGQTTFSCRWRFSVIVRCCSSTSRSSRVIGNVRPSPFLVGSPPTPRSTQLATRHDGRLTDVPVSSALLECLFGTRYNRLSLANVNQLLDQDSTVRVEIAPSVSRPTQPYSARRGPRCTRRTNHWFGPIPDVESGLRDLYSAFRCIVPQVWPTLATCKRSAPDRR